MPPARFLGEIEMKTKKILVLSHIPQRDEIVDQLLVNALSQVNNVAVWKYPILVNPRMAICLLKPDIVVIPEVRIEFTRDMCKYLKEWGVTVVQRRCEMGVSAETEMTDELERCLFGNVDWMNHVDIDLVWGKKFADMLVKHKVPRKKIRLIGGIGFDPYFVEMPQEPRGKKKRVLFAGGFGYADKSALYAVPESKPGEKINAVLVKSDRENRIIFSQLIAAFIKRFPDWEVGIRGHPGEKYQFYSDIFGDKVKSIEMCVAPVAVNWADLIIHPGSTLAYEAHLMKKPTLNFRNTNLDAVVGKIAPTFQDIDKLLDAVDKVTLNKSNADLKIIKQLNKYYGKVDGKAYQRAAEIILNLPTTKTNIPNSWPKDEPKYKTMGVYVNLQYWQCNSCANTFWSEPGRNSTKCPWCGIGCSIIRYMPGTHPITGREEIREILT